MMELEGVEKFYSVRAGLQCSFAQGCGIGQPCRPSASVIGLNTPNLKL